MMEEMYGGLMLIAILLIGVGRSIMLYRKASRLLNEGKYEAAAEAFRKLGIFAGANKMSKYASAQAEAESKYNAALETYKKASKLLNDGQYKAAAEAFHKLGTFSDASKMSLYALALAEAESGNPLKSFKIFTYLDTFKDSEQTLYYKARMYEVENLYDAALEAYSLIPFFKDSQERIAKIEMHAYRLNSSRSGFSEGFACVVNKDGKKGFIDTTGKLVIPCKWDAAGSFVEGFAAVKKDKKWGFIDTIGKLVIPCEWDEVSNFAEGFARVKKDEKWGFINTKGELAIPCEWGWAVSFVEGFARVTKDGKCGYINTKGELVIPCEWDKAENFSEGFAVVIKNKEYGFIDMTGKLVTPCIWDYAMGFSDGYARVEVEKNRKRGIIDTTGKLVSNFDWNEDAYKFYYEQAYHNLDWDGIAYGEGYYLVEKHDYLFIYDASGKKVF